MQVLAWSVSVGADGVRVLAPPGGRALGWVEVRERERPLVPFLELLGRRIEALHTDGVRDATAERARRVTTLEAELAAIATITGTRDGERVEHTLGVIYTDDFQVCIDGRAARADQRTAVRGAVRELVMHFPTGLGDLRYRRYWYRPPAGWHGIARGLVTTWYPPEFPSVSASIKVLPARPYRQSPAVLQIDSLVHDDSFASFTPERPIVRGDGDFDGFTCIISRAVGRFTDPEHDDSRRQLITAGLMDGRYVYSLRLDTGEHRAAEHEQLFLDLVRTCVAIPMPNLSETREVFDHWLD